MNKYFLQMCTRYSKDSKGFKAQQGLKNKMKEEEKISKNIFVLFYKFVHHVYVYIIVIE